MFEEDRPKPKTRHDIGQDLATLSVAELEERIGLLKSEIARLEEAKASKSQHLSAAAALFR
jgi:uncharacterized small protein (DUF1192 family)